MDKDELKRRALSIRTVLDFAFEGIVVSDECGKVLAIKHGINYKRADEELYKAKRKSGNNYSIFKN